VRTYKSKSIVLKAKENILHHQQV